MSGLMDKEHLGGYMLPSAVLGLIVILIWRWSTKSTFPTVNSYSRDITLKRAHSEFMTNARGLIKEGIETVR
jgi:ABC-type sugar transport system permease subunit